MSTKLSIETGILGAIVLRGVLHVRLGLQQIHAAGFFDGGKKPVIVRVHAESCSRGFSNMYRKYSLCLSMIVMSCLFLATSGKAETMSYADAITVLAKECRSDIKRHCKGMNLGNGAIQACLEAKASTVSATCTTTLQSVVSSIAQRRTAQQNYFKVCRHAIAQRCKGMRGDGNILGCLIMATKHISDECNQTITDAGWR